MKKAIFMIMAVLAVFGMVSCGGSSSSGGTADTNTTLSRVKIANSADTSVVMNSNAATLEAALALTVFTEVDISNSQKTDALVTLGKGSQFNGTMKVAKGSTALTEADFTDYVADTTKFTFANEDKLYVKMTAGDGKTVRYYAVKVFIGRDASLADIEFTDFTTTGGQTIGVGDSGLGTPQDAVASFGEGNTGSIQMPMKQPSNGFIVEAIPQDDDATVSISADGTDWTTYTNATSRIVFTDGGFLYVKVVSQNTAVTKFYKIKMSLLRSVKIPYGTPSTISAESPDAIWLTNAATDWLEIDRPNVSEGSGYADLPAETRTHGRAKLMFDEDGLWIYAQVWEKVISEAATGEHTISSVELFINELYGDGVTTGNVTDNDSPNGGQYRLGAKGEMSGAGSNAKTDFIALNKKSAKVYDTGMVAAPAGKNDFGSGYVVIFQAPWRFPEKHIRKTPANYSISIELQINATDPDSGSRAGVLNWNNEKVNSYGSLQFYGEAELVLGANELGPQRPTITAQPTRVNVEKEEADNDKKTLKVEATAPAGDLTYQWYSATTVDGVYAPINNAEGDTYIIDASTTGDTYYYVAVTTTVGNKTNTSNSLKVRARVYDASSAVEYELDLDTVITDFWKDTNADFDAATKEPPAGDGFADGKINWTYKSTSHVNNSGMKGWLELKSKTGGTAKTEEMIAAIQDATSVTIIIVGASDPVDAVFRVGFGDYAASNWSASSLTVGAFNSFAGVDESTAKGNAKAVTMNANAYLAKGLLLQQRVPTPGSMPYEADVEITQIIIKVNY